MKPLYNHKIMGQSSANGVPSALVLQNKGAVLRWFPSDTEEKFKHHIENPETRKQLISLGWAHRRTLEPTEILYDVNSYGFRTYDLHDPDLVDNCALFLGCSNMFGIGVFNKDTIPEKFRSLQPDLIPVNLGVPGGSLDACIRLAMYWVPILRPQVIFLMHPPGIRRELYIDQYYDAENGTQLGDRWVQFQVGTKLPEPLRYDTFERVFTQPLEEEANRARNLYALKGLAFEWQAMLIEGDMRDIPWDIRKDTTARDLNHPGPQSWRWMADYFNKIYTRRCSGEELDEE